MKMNFLKYTFAAVSAVISLNAAAQNLDPTVVVNRAYEGKLLDVQKPDLDMAVPDTVNKFDLDFDYSVFENPYKGSYEFKPYQLMLKPTSSDRHNSVFWLRAGAGYSLYPELEAVWTPFQKGRFKMNVYADYDAYIGEYRSFKPVISDKNTILLSRWKGVDQTTALWNGYRMTSKAGVDGRYDWDKSMLTFDVGYYGIASKDTLKNRMYDALDVRVDMASKPRDVDYFRYEAFADYRFAEDKLAYKAADEYLAEHDLSMGVTLGPVTSNPSRMLFDVGFNAVNYSGAFDASLLQFVFTPHYLFVKGNWNIDVGVKVDKLFRQKESQMYATKDQIVYPDVNVRFNAVSDLLALYFKADGGNRINTYSSLLLRNPYTDPAFGRGEPLLDATVDRAVISLGADGTLFKKLSYDFRLGMASCASGLLDYLTLVDSGNGVTGFVSGYRYAQYMKYFVGLDLSMDTDRFRFDGAVEYAHYSGLEGMVGLFSPSPFTGNIAFDYNWNRRVYAGIDCNFATARRGRICDEAAAVITDPYLVRIPGYADLGIYGEYAFNRKLSFWLRGGNLLNMTIQRTPLYAERGINFTLGVCLNL